MNSVYKKKAPVFAFGYAEAGRGTEAEGTRLRLQATLPSYALTRCRGRERLKGRFLTSEFLNTHL